MVINRAIARLRQSLLQRVNIIDHEGRVRLPCRDEGGVDAKMHFERPSFEPASAPRRKMRRLRLLWNAEKAGVKRARFVFLAGGMASWT